MKTIKIKGEKDGFVVSDEVGSKLREAKQSGKDGWVDLNGFSGMISDIKYIIDGVDEDNRSKYKEQVSDESRKRNDEDISYSAQKYRDEMIANLKLSYDDKIKFNLKIANFYCYALTSEWLDDFKIKNDLAYQNLLQIIKDELKLTDLYVSPIKYKKVFKFLESRDNYNHRYGAMRLMERVISCGVYEISLIKKYGRKIA